jgi:polyisoprenoid-binding protein YceI
MTWVVAFVGAAALLASAAAANAESWAVITDGTKVEFTGVQMGVPTRAEFASVTAEIDFDPDNLSASSIKVVIDLDSVTTAYPVIAQTLRQEPWFDVANFPLATFEVNETKRLSDSRFEAHGALTLRGVKQPVIFTFELKEYGPNRDKPGWLKAVVEAESTVQRTAFDVGQGEWGATSVVADDVTIQVQLSAERPITP